MTDSPRVFVSHSHSDSAFVRRFVDVLRDGGLDVWYDADNLSAGALTSTIERELHSRPIFILILSPEALASRWVSDEARWAYNLYRRDQSRIILPVLAAPLDEDDIWLFLQDFKRIEGPRYQPYMPEEAAQRVLQALGLSSNTATPDKEYVEELIDRGTTLRASGDPAAALALFAEASKHAPESVDAWINYGLALAEVKRPDEALMAFNQALVIDPKSELALRSLGDTLLAFGRYSEAVEAYDHALERNRTYVTAWYNRGTALLALKQFEEAVENYRTLQELDPRNSDPYMFQADALWQIGRQREALAAYEQAIELKPGSLGDLTRPIRTLIRRYQ